MAFSDITTPVCELPQFNSCLMVLIFKSIMGILLNIRIMSTFQQIFKSCFFYKHAKFTFLNYRRYFYGIINMLCNNKL